MASAEIKGMHIPLEVFEVVLGNLHIHIERFRTEGFDGVEILFSNQAEVVRISPHRFIAREMDNYGVKEKHGS